MKSLPMKPRQHQIDGAVWAIETIREHGLAYLSWKERTGKTLTALTAAEYLTASRVLIVTKKKAIEGWEDTLRQWTHSKHYTVINYESIHKLGPVYDFIILDEAHHGISGIGRKSKTWKAVRQFTKKKAILYLSATPYAEHVGLLYHQLALSDWSPFRKYKDFYAWYKTYGIPNMIRTPYGLQDQRNKYKTEEVLAKVEHLFNFKTRQDVGIKHEPTVRVVKVPLHEKSKQYMEDISEKGYMEINGTTILADSDSKRRAMHYQLEGGTIKHADSSYELGTNEKLVYIRSSYDISRTAVMCHFIAERDLLSRAIPKLKILSSDGDAEGVDLSHYDKLVIYSMSFKTSKHTQRVARQANHDRATPIEVDVLVSDKPGIGLAVYEAVAVKEENFIKASYERAIQ